MLCFSTFQLDCTGTPEDSSGSSDSIVYLPRMADTTLVADHEQHDPCETFSHKTFKNKSCSTKQSQGGSPNVPKTKSNCLLALRKHYESKGLNNSVIHVLMNSWRSSTKEQYFVYLRKWFAFIKNSSPTTKLGLKFLVNLFKQGASFSQLSLARSAISLVIDTGNSDTFGKQAIVKRFMKGVFELRPSLPRYHLTWNINVLFQYFRTMPHQRELKFSELGKKLALLIALLAGGQRCQTLHAINVLHITVLNDRCVIPIYTTLKHTRVGTHLHPLEFRVYLPEEKLCVVNNLKWYIQKTMTIRHHPALFLSTIQPHHPITKDTLSRWCRSMMKRAGIDITKYTTHSSRSAASSFAKKKGVPLKRIIGAGGWSHESTFATYYDKEIERTEVPIADALLN